MAALDDIKTGEAAIMKAVADVAAYLKSLATTVTGGLTAAEAATVATDLNAQAAAIEALIPAAGTTPPPAGGPPVG